MPDVVRAFPLVLPPNGSVNSVFFVNCPLEDSNVVKILLVFPPGCSGLVGVRVEHGGTQIFPLDPGTWFIFDDYTIELDPSEPNTSGQWHVAGYNLDTNQHTISSYFFYNRIDRSQGSTSSSLVSL